MPAAAVVKQSRMTSKNLQQVGISRSCPSGAGHPIDQMHHLRPFQSTAPSANRRL